MSSYKKYAMMGVSTLLLPLVKGLIKKMIGKFTEPSEDDFDDETVETSRPDSRQFKRSAE